MPNSPVLFGPNNTANNLQNAMLNADGSLHAKNGGVSVAKNYITYGNFENGSTTGWSLGTVGTLTNGIPTGSPTFGSGASGNLSIATVTSGQLAGTTSLSLVSSAATTQGNMLASQAYSIDIADQAKVLQWQFYYSVVSGSGNFSGTSSNSFGVALWDATNSVWLPSNANFAMVQSSGVGYASGTVQVGASTASIQLVIYAANATSGAITLYFDQFSLSPQMAPIGLMVGGIVSAGTITIGAVTTAPTYGTQTANSVSWYRSGQNAIITYSFAQTTAGTAGSGDYLVSLPSGLAADTTKIPIYNSATANLPNVPAAQPSMLPMLEGMMTDGTNNTGALTAYLYSTTQFRIGIYAPSSSNFTNWTSGKWPFSSTALGFNFTIQVPIAGWSATQVQSSDTDTRVIAFVGTNASASVSAGANTTLTATLDTAGGWSTNVYTVQVSGVYSVGVAGQMSAVSSLAIYLNGSLYSLMSTAAVIGYMSTGNLLLGNLSAGATISLRCNVTTTSTNTVFTINRLSGPSVIAATESVNACYYVSANFTASSTTPINFDSKVYDSHNAVTTSATAWRFTAPVSGVFNIGGFISLTSNSSAFDRLYKNGSQFLTLQSNTTNNVNNTPNADIRLNAGDYIDVRPSSSVTYTGGALATDDTSYITIKRVGN